MIYLNNLLRIVSFLAFIFLTVQSAYLFLFAIAGRLKKRRAPHSAGDKGSFVIYIPAYKEDSVIVDSAIAALTLNYPQHKRHVVVIADSLKPATMASLAALPLQVVTVSFSQSTKAKALNLALQQTSREFDHALILDADNICHPDFLHQMNDALASGYQVVQGQRVAKNTNTNFAFLDAVSEGVNNHIFREGHRAVGLSCAIIGSGFALNFGLFKNIMPEITAVGGFDKEMELRLLRNKIRVEYAPGAVVYDEKTAKPANFENQRRRWLAAQVHYMRKYSADGFLLLFKGNIDYFDKVLQTMLLPRVLMPGCTFALFLVSWLPGSGVPPMYWFLLFSVTCFSVIISVPKQYITGQLFAAALSLPRAFFSVFRLLFKLKDANKTFIHTVHGEPPAAR